MYNKNEFEDVIVDYLQELFPDVEVKEDLFSKDGLEKTKIFYLSDHSKSSTSPIIYVEQMYEAYTCGTPLSEFRSCLRTLKLNSNCGRVEDFFNKDFVDYLYIILFDKSFRPNLDQFVRKDFLNLTQTLSVIRERKEGDGVNKSIIKIDNLDNVLSSVSLTEEDLWALAKKNISKCDYTLSSSSAYVLAEQNGVECPKIRLLHDSLNEPLVQWAKNYCNAFSFEDLFILRNESLLNTTMALLDNRLLEFLAKIFDGNYYILPSSTEELIITPASHTRLEMLKKLVHDVNVDVVLKQQIIFTDEIFYYDTHNNKLVQAGHYED